LRSPEKTLEIFKDRLREQGIRITHQRLEILREVVYSRGHPSISEVFQAVRKRIPPLSLDTVYRTMKKLSELGLIHPVGYSSDGIRYDADGTPHHHFLCAVCGEAYDFRCPDLDTVPVPEEAMALGEVTGSRMEIRGICRKCLDRRREKNGEQ
jgi:Fur family peroxide stress response transcriptional regulator